MHQIKPETSNQLPTSISNPNCPLKSRTVLEFKVGIPALSCPITLSSQWERSECGNCPEIAEPAMMKSQGYKCNELKHAAYILNSRFLQISAKWFSIKMNSESTAFLNGVTQGFSGWVKVQACRRRAFWKGFWKENLLGSSRKSLITEPKYDLYIYIYAFFFTGMSKVGSFFYELSSQRFRPSNHQTKAANSFQCTLRICSERVTLSILNVRLQTWRCKFIIYDRQTLLYIFVNEPKKPHRSCFPKTFFFYPGFQCDLKRYGCSRRLNLTQEIRFDIVCV